MVVSASKLPYLLAAISLMLLAGTLLHQSNGVPESWKPHFDRPAPSPGKGLANPSSLTSPSSPSSKDTRPTFYDIALSHGTDKVTKHHYHHMYQKYLSPLRDTPLKMLEIGLGCDMSYGPGASFYTWLDYLPYVDLYFIEYDGACAEKWAANTSAATIYAGDQADVAFLKRFMETAGTDFDVVVDDGGHTMVQQRTSLETLWRAVKPGGIYFCEDLQTSYWEDYQGTKDVWDLKKKTMVQMVKGLVDDLHVGPGGHRRQYEVSVDMQSVDCMEEVCAFVKKEA